CLASRSFSVVVATSSYQDFVFRVPIHESVFCSDASRPVASELVFQRLWLANAVVAVPRDVFNQGVDTPNDPFIVDLPPHVVFPRVCTPYEPHSEGELEAASGCSSPSPRSNDSIDSSSRFAFAGDRIRCAVSFRASYSSRETITAGSRPALVTITSIRSSTTESSTCA